MTEAAERVDPAALKRLVRLRRTREDRLMGALRAARASEDEARTVLESAEAMHARTVAARTDLERRIGEEMEGRALTSSDFTERRLRIEEADRAVGHAMRSRDGAAQRLARAAEAVAEARRILSEATRERRRWEEMEETVSAARKAKADAAEEGATEEESLDRIAGNALRE